MYGILDRKKDHYIYSVTNLMSFSFSGIPPLCSVHKYFSCIVPFSKLHNLLPLMKLVVIYLKYDIWRVIVISIKV